MDLNRNSTADTGEGKNWSDELREGSISIDKVQMSWHRTHKVTITLGSSTMVSRFLTAISKLTWRREIQELLVDSGKGW